MNKGANYLVEFTNKDPKEIQEAIVKTRVSVNGGKYPPAELTLMRHDNSLGLYLFTYMDRRGTYMFACATLFNKTNSRIRLWLFRIKIGWHILTHKINWD